MMNFFSDADLLENFEFLKNCPYDFDQTRHVASYSYGVRVQPYIIHARSLTGRLGTEPQKSNLWPFLTIFGFLFNFLKNSPYDLAEN